MKFPVQLPQQLSATSPGLIGRAALAGGALLLGQWFLGDVLHVPGGGLGLLVAAGGVIWFSKRSKLPHFQPPESLDGWTQRCREVLDQYQALEGGVSDASRQREADLQAVLDRSGPQRLALVGVPGTVIPDPCDLKSGLIGTAPLTLSVARPLEPVDGVRCWPVALCQQDVVVHVLQAPLMAADLLWLQQLPEDLPAWLLVEGLASGGTEDFLAQLSRRWQDRLLIRQTEGGLRHVLQPLRNSLRSEEITLARTRLRLLADLHRGWQLQLEHLRRDRFQSLQQRTQWIVAASVLASPVATIDLLAVAVANGLMIREMAEIWGCRLSLDLLREAAAQLAQAALAQGVVEWSSQMLLGLAKLDGGSWLAAGAMQALSAAYLTRVVGRSMADWLALNVGVKEPDLEMLKRQAPLLVARASEEERLDWSAFLTQSRSWLTT